MIVTNNSEIAEKSRALRNYGERKKYHYDTLGYNSRLDELQAAVLRVKLHHLDEWIGARRKNAGRYSELLGGLRGVGLPFEDVDTASVYYCYVIRSERRDQLRRWLQARGVETEIHYPVPIHLQRSYRHLGYSRGSFPVAEKLAGQVLSLPIFPELTEDEIEHVAESIEKFQTKVGF
jgi:dTDP-4-amino-4,6-dideoxygalactose transaminase